MEVTFLYSNSTKKQKYIFLMQEGMDLEFNLIKGTLEALNEAHNLLKERVMSEGSETTVHSVFKGKFNEEALRLINAGTVTLDDKVINLPCRVMAVMCEVTSMAGLLQIYTGSYMKGELSHIQEPTTFEKLGRCTRG